LWLELSRGFAVMLPDSRAHIGRVHRILNAAVTLCPAAARGLHCFGHHSSPLILLLVSRAYNLWLIIITVIHFYSPYL
jgi:hypothetical protein